MLVTTNYMNQQCQKYLSQMFWWSYIFWIASSDGPTTPFEISIILGKTS